MDETIDISEIRRRLAASGGKSVWKSLEEAAGTEEFRQAVRREFPSWASRWENCDDVSRRNLLKVMGGALALMGLTGCFYKRPQSKIVPYPSQPEETVPGRPVFFATAMPFSGWGRGVLALSREGRPTKIEGNPDHPASLGGTDLFMQGSVLDLYDPDRSHTVTVAGQIARWGDFQDALQERLAARKDGQGVRILTGNVTSPLHAAQMEEFLRRYPKAVWHQYEPMEEGNPDIFAEPVQPIYDFRAAGVIVSFANDFLFDGPMSLRYARHFIDGRRVRQAAPRMNRLYVIEGTLTLTGAKADHRMALAPSRIEPMVRGLAAKLGIAEAGEAQLTAEQKQWVDAMAADLLQAGPGTPLVLAGRELPPAAHGLVHLMNQKLGALGKTAFFIEPVAAAPQGNLAELAADLVDGKVDTLVMIGVNPVYNAPADVPMQSALQEMTRRGGFSAAMASHYDETSFNCLWHIPAAHYLESWGDVRAQDGSASIIQPLIAPLYGAHTQWELMETMLGRPDRDGLEIVRDFWRERGGAQDYEAWWVRSLQKGVIDKTASAYREAPRLRADLFTPKATAGAGGIDVIYRPDFSAWDGAFTNNAWLEETPRPFTKLTWDNAVAINLRMAEKWAPRGKKSLIDGDVVRITVEGRQIEAPVMLQPGQADDTVTLYLGYGRRLGGTLLLDEGKPRGYSAYALRTGQKPWAMPAAKIETTGDFHFLVMTRNHHALTIEPGMPTDADFGVAPWLKPEVIAQPGDSDTDLEVLNRKIVRTATLQEFVKDRNVIKHLDPDEEKKPLLSLYKEWNYQHGLQWGMNIDMTACIGCNACMVACQAENNVAVVGKQEVSRQREMHWIRIDDYFGGDPDSPRIYHQPVPCMQCENAPCEYVCPVGATTHSDEGLNEMTYNRCIGTRYCSNNCPYKVRRFNFFLFSDYATPTLKMVHNPDVTVRSRGVMEKCTYCVQRIDNTRTTMEEQVLDLEEQARQAAGPAERDRLMKQAMEHGVLFVRRLETACQQACPTRAIIFGDIRDAGSDVAKLKSEPSNYGLLTELTTRPRTTYLAQFTNPNSKLREGAGV
ncbi:MAG TPA: TAT-variant-translocated molybdopterin oxidoreductase [Tepidisphaeraceae bacterium]|nr:TAT-variant-translocated molybdopterin oxidoreductase [Tepidisphaeraceae bacterium]